MKINETGWENPCLENHAILNVLCSAISIIALSRLCVYVIAKVWAMLRSAPPYSYGPTDAIKSFPYSKNRTSSTKDGYVQTRFPYRVYYTHTNTITCNFFSSVYIIYRRLVSLNERLYISFSAWNMNQCVVWTTPHRCIFVTMLATQPNYPTERTATVSTEYHEFQSDDLHFLL